MKARLVKECVSLICLSLARFSFSFRYFQLSPNLIDALIDRSKKKGEEAKKPTENNGTKWTWKKCRHLKQQ